MNRFALLAALVASPLLAQTTQPKILTETDTRSTANVMVLSGDDAATARVFAFQTMEKSNFLGVGTNAAGEAMAAQFKLPKGSGLVVESVEKDSPADKAGLKQYDVIASIDDQILFNTEQLRSLLRSKEDSAAVTLHVIRGGQKVEAKATLAMREQTPAFVASGAPWTSPASAIGVARAADPLRAVPGMLTRIIRRDDDKQIVINRQGDEPIQVIVIGGDDKEIFSGKIKDTADLSSVPEAYRAQVKQAIESVNAAHPASAPAMPKR